MKFVSMTLLDEAEKTQYRKYRPQLHHLALLHASSIYDKNSIIRRAITPRR